MRMVGWPPMRMRQSIAALLAAGRSAAVVQLSVVRLLVVLLSVVPLSVVLSSCGVGASDSPGSVVRDSAGIAIVENRVPAWEPGAEWRLSAEPSLRIGVTDGDPAYQFFRVWSLSQARDGGILVANDGTREIRVFDGEGRFRRSMGGPGDGPGEFRQVSAVEPLGGDTLLVVDLQHRRLTALAGTTGEVFWTAPLEAHGRIPRGRPAMLPDGGFVLGWMQQIGLQQVGPGGARPGETVRSEATVFRYALDGTVTDTIGTFPAAEEAVVSEGGRVSTTMAPFARGLTYAAGGGGVYIGTQDDYEVAVHTAMGAPSRVIRWTGPDLAVTERAIDELAERTGWETMRTLPRPPTRAAYGDLVVDAGRNLWVSDFRVHGRLWPEAWEVFDPDGRWLGRIAVPAGLRIFEIGDDWVLGTWHDDLGVEYVHLYGIEKPAAGRR